MATEKMASAAMGQRTAVLAVRATAMLLPSVENIPKSQGRHAP